MRCNQWDFICGLILFLIKINTCLCLALSSPKRHFDHFEPVSSASDRSTESMSAGEEDEDSDEGSGHDDDDDDDAVQSERKTGVVVAAVPVVLGLVTVILLCFLMICRRNQRLKAKWTSRQPQICLSSSDVSCSSSDSSGLADRMAYVETYEVLDGPASPDVCPPSCPSAIGVASGPEEDLPPSYEEVMSSERYRNITNRSIVTFNSHVTVLT